jgi:2-polyprenyl-3-methyl-5-hydroxy-6-metoxy-1,4-benzoquinol methylase
VNPRHHLRRVLYAEPLARLAEKYLEAYAAWRHLGAGAPSREWFDHRADLHLFRRSRLAYWAERGVYAREVMFDGCRVLDLCCGDGFYPFHFYSSVAGHIDAVDVDPGAIAHAREYYSLPGIAYARLDVARDSFPDTEYDVITWDGAIEHFTPDEIQSVLGKCASAMVPGGVLHGMTILVDERSTNPWHENEFRTETELERAIGTVFPHVSSFETIYPDRHNIYFRASLEGGRLGRFAEKSCANAGDLSGETRR